MASPLSSGGTSILAAAAGGAAATATGGGGGGAWVTTMRADSTRGAAAAAWGAAAPTGPAPTAAAVAAGDWAELIELPAHTDHIRALTLLPATGAIVSASHDKTLCLWEAPVLAGVASAGVMTGKPSRTFMGHIGRVMCATVLEDGTLVSGADDSDKLLAVWNMATALPAARLEGHVQRITALAPLGGRRLVSASMDCTLRVWDAGTTAPLHTVPIDGTFAWGVTALDDGTLVTANDNGTVKLHAPPTGACAVTLTGHTGRVFVVVQAGDGRVATGSDDRSVRLWDLRSNTCTGTLSGHSGSVLSLASFHSSGAPGDPRIVSGSSDKTARLWDLRMLTSAPAPSAATGAACLGAFTGHGGSVYAVAALPHTGGGGGSGSSGRVATGGSDKVLRVWSIAKGLRPVPAT